MKSLLTKKKTAKTTIWRNFVQKYWLKYHILKMLFFELGATKLHFFVSWGTLLCLACLLSVHFVAFATTTISTLWYKIPKKMFSSFYKIIIFSVNLFIFFWILSHSSIDIHFMEIFIFWHYVCFSMYVMFLVN